MLGLIYVFLGVVLDMAVFLPNPTALQLWFVTITMGLDIVLCTIASILGIKLLIQFGKTFKDG